jgi:outer membrane protein OmpA-like peptidoglycan-associated protein
MVAAGKADRNLIFLIKEHTEGLKPSSQAYLSAKVRGLRIFQELVRKGVDPAQIEFMPIKQPKGAVDVVEIETKKGDSSKSTKMVTPSQDGAGGDREFIINFASASAEPLNLSSDRLAVFLKSVGQPGNDALIIEGYTDSSGNPAYNKALSELRALRTYEILARTGLPPYRIDTRGMGIAKVVGGKGQTEAEKQAARRVIFRWITDAKIAAIAAEEDKKVSPPPPPPAPVAQVKAVEQEAPKAEPVKAALEPKVQHSVLDIIAFAGGLQPLGEWGSHAKAGAHAGLGLGRVLWVNDNSEGRINLLGSLRSSLKAKETDRSGPVDLSVYSLRFDYAFGVATKPRPFIGAGVGYYIWNADITMPSAELTNKGDGKDTGVSLIFGYDLPLSQSIFIAPELTYNRVAGDFVESFMTATASLRWRI